MGTDYCKKSPCNNCPYRRDAPLALWSVEEFKKLIEKEEDLLGVVYGCHKKDGHVCVGWLMNQDKNNFPSIALRISLSKNKVDRTYLDALHCKSELFDDVYEMAKENFPDDF